jgi:hypothetical protein
MPAPTIPTMIFGCVPVDCIVLSDDVRLNEQNSFVVDSFDK